VKIKIKKNKVLKCQREKVEVAVPEIPEVNTSEPLQVTRIFDQIPQKFYTKVDAITQTYHRAILQIQSSKSSQVKILL
jgi:hypothetical protein